MRTVFFVLYSLVLFVILVAAPAFAHPVRFNVDGIVESSRLFLGADKSLCRLPDGSYLSGLSRVELEIIDPLDAPPATAVVCLADTACECAGKHAGSAFRGEGLVIGGELVLFEVSK